MTLATYSPAKTNRINRQKGLSHNVHMILTEEELKIETDLREATNTPKRTDLYKKMIRTTHALVCK